MNILQVCPRYHPYIGGVEEHVLNISERLAKEHNVSVFTTDPSGKLPKEDVINNVYVRTFKSWAPSNAYYFSMALKKSLMEHSDRYDIVHAHSYHAFPALYAAQAKKKSKLFFTPHYHGAGHTFFRELLHVPYHFLGKKIFEKADRVICVSNYERELVTNSFEINEKKVLVLPNGLNLEEFQGLKKRSNDCKTILYVGRLEKYKGVHYLIKALLNVDNNIVLEIVGKGSYKRQLFQLTRKLGLEGRIKFFQDLPRNELLKKYADANLFVLLSKHEAYGISVAEALASGTPCIVTTCSALTEWVDDENCFGIDYPIQLNELGNLIDSVVGKNVKNLKLLDWNKITEKLVNLYECC